MRVLSFQESRIPTSRRAIRKHYALYVLEGGKVMIGKNAMYAGVGLVVHNEWTKYTQGHGAEGEGCIVLRFWGRQQLRAIAALAPTAKVKDGDKQINF